jgi:AraC-like DNA-binding protein
MHFTELTSVVNLIILGIHVFAQLAAAILIYIKHHEPYNRSWKYIFGFFVMSAIASTVEIALVTNQAFTPQSYKLLDPLINIPGFYIFALLLCYIIELIHPLWLNFKRLLLLFMPSLLCALVVLLFVVKGDISTISSFNDLHLLVGEPNVIARLVFLGIYIPYFIFLIILRLQAKATHAAKYHDTLVLITTLLCISYVFSRGLQLYLGYITHEILYLLLSVVIVYFEHYERLHVPLEKVRDYYTWDQLPHATQNTVNTVAQALQRIMNDPSVWQDSELTGDKIVHLVGTNRTYIQQAAKQLGFANLSDMLNRRRIDYVCQQLRKDPNIPVQTLFVDAGYRSRTTAWRHFTTIVGCTPSEFLERHANTEKSRT